MGAWVVGQHIVGYLPDSDPYVVSEWRGARDHLIDLIVEWADQDDESWISELMSDGIDPWDGSDHAPSSVAWSRCVQADIRPDRDTPHDIEYTVNPNSPGQSPRAFFALWDDNAVDPECDAEDLEE